MKGMGEIGELFIEWQGATKELQFVESLSSRLYGDIFHPQFKVPGTYTGRLSGAGGFSMQILPKTPSFLEAFRPRPGHKLVDIDVSALEPVVLTELSRDEGLLSVYGPNASPHADIYLTVGARLGSVGQAFRDCGYDYKNPTKEAASRCKKEHKNLRGIVKKLHLSCIAEGELVQVRGHGLIPIDKVVCGMLVWDGQEWVTTDGAILNGVRDTMQFNNIGMTPDHEVLTNVGWEISERANPSQCIKPKQSGYRWADVWGLVRNIFGVL
jgi:hypothetical protein